MGAGVDTYSPRIRDALSRLRETATDDDWRAMALSGVDATAAEETVQAIAQSNRDAADILSVWFGERAGQALRLRRQVRDAVTPMLRGSRALLATGGRVTRRPPGSNGKGPRSPSEPWRHVLVSISPTGHQSPATRRRPSSGTC